MTTRHLLLSAVLALLALASAQDRNDLYNALAETDSTIIACPAHIVDVADADPDIAAYLCVDPRDYNSRRDFDLSLALAGYSPAQPWETQPGTEQIARMWIDQDATHLTTVLIAAPDLAVVFSVTLDR